MSESALDIKVRLAGARAAKHDADQVAGGVRSIGNAEQKVAEKGKLAELSMRGVERTSHKLRGTVGLLLGATGIGGLVFGLGEVVHSTIAAQTAQARLQRSMRNAGLSWQVYGTHVEDALDKQAEFSGFQKGDVADSLSNFIRTTGNVTKALKLNSLAIDVARTRGIGLGAAQSLLARVYNGSYIGLKRLGVGIKPVTVHTDLLRATTKKATIEQVRQAKALDAQATRTKALAIVQQKFGGQTAAWGKTAEGSVARAKVALELAQEQIGQVLLPYVARGAQKIAEVAKAFVRNWPEIKDRIKSDVAAVRRELDPLLAFMDKHKKGLAEFAGGFIALAGGLRLLGKVTGGKGALGTLGKVTGSKTLARFAERGSTPANPIWVAVVGKGTGTDGFLKTALKKVIPAAAGATAADVGLAGAGAGALIGAPLLAHYLGQRRNRLHPGAAQRDRDEASRQLAALHPPSKVPEFDAQGFPTGKYIEVHTHVMLNDREIATAVHRAANQKLALR